jgi:mannitol-1-phosphate 5-dehydrogenase
MVSGTTYLKSEVFKYFTEDIKGQIEQLVGFIDSAVDRIVPPAEASDNIWDVTVKSVSEWIVD